MCGTRGQAPSFDHAGFTHLDQKCQNREVVENVWHHVSMCLCGLPGLVITIEHLEAIALCTNMNPTNLQYWRRRGTAGLDWGEST